MSTSAEEKKSEDKKDIEMEEREKMLNAENKVQDKVATENADENKELSKIKTDCREGREVKPKKIPIGGIQMPGFFTRSRSKEKCKETETDQEVEVSELLEDKEKEKKDDSLMSQARIKLPNPFRKSKIEDDDKPETQKKKLMDTIRLPLVSVKKNKDNSKTLETQAELASMETLGDNDKSGNGEEMKTVALDEKMDLEKNEENEPTWKQKMRAYRIVISALLVFVLLIIVIIAIILPGKDHFLAATNKDGQIVETITSCGPVEGILNDGAVAFRGVPYARPPLQDLRFRPAQPLNNVDYCWNNTFVAHNSSDLCLQILDNNTIIGNEDCLTLDVVTPYVRYDNPLPVIVLIGADSLIGGAPGKMRPSARYARSRDVVFVRPNFRLGVLGFLALETLTKSEYPYSSGNYGLSDIIEALRWIQLNIEHFGGDPKAVTLFGHKAGATLVTALSTMKDAQKLFARAWSTSGGALYPTKSLSEAETDNFSYLDSVQCKDATCLREMDASALLNAVEDTWRKPQPDLPAKGELSSKRHEWLVLDGKILIEPISVWEDKELPVKLVIGTTAHVCASEKLLMKHKVWSEDLVAEHVKNSFLTDVHLVEETLKLYPKTYKGLVALISEIRIICPLYAASLKLKKVPFYVVTQPRNGQDLADGDTDVDAILGRYEPKTPEQRRYLSTMQQLFYHYVWHGEIKHMEADGEKVLIIRQDHLPATNYSHCDLWMENDVVPTYAQLD